MPRGAANGFDPSRPTLRDLARAAGVSAMTVSRALNHRPRVSPETRTRIAKIAAQLDYRPDPHVAKLMHHLRTRRRRAVFQGSITALTNRPPAMEREYTAAIFQGAAERSRALGYACELLHLDRTPRPRERLGRMLRDRGVEGILLLPMARQEDLGDLLDWREFSVIAATSSVDQPRVHRVTPHQYANTLALCRELTARGYRRIGLVIDAAHDTRVDHGMTAAVLWHNRALQPSLPPLCYPGEVPVNLLAWCRAHAPDVIVTTGEHKCREIAHLLGPRLVRTIGLASTDVLSKSRWCGIDEFPSEIGAIAVDALASMIQRGMKGVPPRPASTLIVGGWREGRSCPPRG